jgi:GH15 family glucan-1,4-alpha-glucosidase
VVAFDRAVKAVERHGLGGDVDRWRDLRDKVRDEVLTQGFDAGRNTFTQHYDTQEVDASLLMLPLVGFLAADDPRMLGTIEAVEEDLMRDGLLLRYRTQTGVDGLAGDEHPFLACSFWLVSAYAAAGGWLMRTRCSTASARSPTTSGCCRRSTTPIATGWSATSPRPSVT